MVFYHFNQLIHGINTILAPIKDRMILRARDTAVKYKTQSPFLSPLPWEVFTFNVNWVQSTGAGHISKMCPLLYCGYRESDKRHPKEGDSTDDTGPGSGRIWIGVHQSTFVETISSVSSDLNLRGSRKQLLLKECFSGDILNYLSRWEKDHLVILSIRVFLFPLSVLPLKYVFLFGSRGKY